MTITMTLKTEQRDNSGDEKSSIELNTKRDRDVHYERQKTIVNCYNFFYNI